MPVIILYDAAGRQITATFTATTSPYEQRLEALEFIDEARRQGHEEAEHVGCEDARGCLWFSHPQALASDNRPPSRRPWDRADFRQRPARMPGTNRRPK